MKRRILAALFVAAAAFNAAAQRVVLEVPLSPRPGLTSAVSVSPAAQAMPLALSAWAPPPLAAAMPLASGAIPIALARPKAAPAIPVLPASVVSRTISAVKTLIRGRPPKAVDSLREHGALSGDLANLQGEAGADAAEKNFIAAAGQGDAAAAHVSGGGEAPAQPGHDPRPLLARLLDHVRLDDRGRVDEKKALEDAFQRALGTPTGRRYAEEFLAEGASAVVRFDDFPDSQLFLVDGRKKFYASQATTEWRDEGYADVRLNRHYIDGDPDNLRESLPSILGHELLGHGLWYARAAKEELYLAFHYHELNETLARLVGWAIDHELDGRFEEAGAWSYLSDPAHYLANLKMRLPYYAVTFSRDEMAKPLQTLRARLATAEREVEDARRSLAAQKTWLPVLDHFTGAHGVPARRFELLRKELADLEAYHQSEVLNAEAIVSDVAGLLERIEAEPDRASEQYLSRASAHPFFERLAADTARLGASLREMAHAAPPAPARPAPPRPSDQSTWEQFTRMYQDDLAADAHRAVKHWN